MKELKIGERVTITLEAIEQEDCKGCFFRRSRSVYNDFRTRCFVHNELKCGRASRSDGKSIIFKEVK